MNQTELTFLLELLLNHKLPKATQLAIKERITQVESNFRPQAPGNYNAAPLVQSKSAQSPSTQRILDEMAKEGTPLIPPGNHEHNTQPAPVPKALVAQTPAAQAALQARDQAIATAISGKEEKGRISPRKF